MDRYYKNEIFLDYNSCREYAAFLNAKMWLNASKNLDKIEKEELMIKFKKYFKDADKLGKKLQIELVNNDINKNNRNSI